MEMEMEMEMVVASKLMQSSDEQSDEECLMKME